MASSMASSNWLGELNADSDTWRFVRRGTMSCEAQVAAIDGEYRWWAHRTPLPPPDAIVVSGHTMIRGTESTKAAAKRTAMRMCGVLLREKFEVRRPKRR